MVQVMDRRYRPYSNGSVQSNSIPPVDYENYTNVSNSTKGLKKPALPSNTDNDDNTGDMKKKTFRGLLTRFAEKTAMQGIPYINSARLWYSKAIWALLTIAALGVSVLHMYYLINLYLQHDTKTQISLNFSPLVMPAITVCNTNPVRKSEVQGDKPNREFADFISRINPENLRPSRKNDNTSNTTGNLGNRGRRNKRFVSTVESFNTSGFIDRKRFRDADKVAEEEELGSEDMETKLRQHYRELYTSLPRHTRVNMGHHISNMLISCSFKGRTCTYKSFTPQLSNKFGNCYTIQSPKYIVESIGPVGEYLLAWIGLFCWYSMSVGGRCVWKRTWLHNSCTTENIMTFFLENHENIPGVNNGHGLRLVIHDRNTTAFPLDDGMFVSGNTETNIGLRMVNITRMSEPYGTCADVHTYETKYGTTYTRQTCQKFCVEEHIMDTCGCFEKLNDDIIMIMNKTGSLGQYGVCRTDAEKKCMYEKLDLYRSGKHTCSCTSPCHETAYNIATSSMTWPVISYAELLLDSVCEKDNETNACDELEKKRGNERELLQNFLKLNVYFEDLNYEKIEEVADYEDIQFASDVGGAIGLWIGLSILSVMELVQLFVELLEFGIYKCCGVNLTAPSKTNKPKSHQKDLQFGEQHNSKKHENFRHINPIYYET